MKEPWFMKGVRTMSDRQANNAGQETEETLVQNGVDGTVAAFLELNENGAVDLDALFDALNIATENGGNAVEFTSDDAGTGGTLTISAAGALHRRVCQMQRICSSKVILFLTSPKLSLHSFRYLP